MKVYRVYGQDYDDTHMGNTYSRKELAEKECAILNKKKQENEVFIMVWDSIQDFSYEQYPRPLESKNKYHYNGDEVFKERWKDNKRQELISFIGDYSEDSPGVFVHIQEIDILDELPKELKQEEK